MILVYSRSQALSTVYGDATDPSGLSNSELMTEIWLECENDEGAPSAVVVVSDAEFAQFRNDPSVGFEFSTIDPNVGPTDCNMVALR